MRLIANAVGDCSIGDSAKLTYLLQFCTGKARSVIEFTSLMEPSMGYRTARQVLKKRFGNEYEICHSVINKIKNQKPVREHDRRSLRDFSDDLNICLEILRSTGKFGELSQSDLLSIISKCPDFMQNRWRKEVREIKRRYSREPDISDLVFFVNNAAEEADDPVFGVQNRFPYRQTHTTESQSVESEQCHDDPNAFSVQSENVRVCPLCTQNHMLYVCDKFKAMTVFDRIKVCREKRLCDNCLNPGHFALSCRRPLTCTYPDCGKKHSRLLHIIRSDTHNIF